MAAAQAPPSSHKPRQGGGWNKDGLGIAGFTDWVTRHVDASTCWCRNGNAGRRMVGEHDSEIVNRNAEKETNESRKGATRTSTTAAAPASSSTSAAQHSLAPSPSQSHDKGGGRGATGARIPSPNHARAPATTAASPLTPQKQVSLLASPELGARHRPRRGLPSPGSGSCVVRSLAAP